MSHLNNISTPTLLLDEDQCRRNIRRMSRKAAEHGVTLRPHFKTHQSADIAEWFAEEGVTAITVSSIKMAEYFADYGWGDITIAFPVNIRSLQRLNRLAERIDLRLLISDSTVLLHIEQQINHSVTLYLEIDTGDHRSGLDPADGDTIDELVNRIQGQQSLTFRGFYSHPGHSYAARHPKEVLTIHRQVLKIVEELKSRYPDALFCIGDTPCCSIAEDFGKADELSPGNFVFYDLMQSRIGSCALSDIAVALAVPVVARYPSRNQVLVHGGAVHLSKDSYIENGRSIYGLPVTLHDEGWSRPQESGYLVSLSQEHGVLECDSSLMEKIETGDLLGILPVHSCLTANLMKEYVTLDGRRLNAMGRDR